MAIDFGSFERNSDSGSENTAGGVTLDLNKNMTLDLTKRNPGLKKILVGAGWDVAETGCDFDLDLCAFLLHNGKIQSADDVIYFNHLSGNGIRLHKDNRTGAGDGDDEKITVSLPEIDASVNEIAFCVVIFDAANRGQTFGMVKNSFIRLVNEENGKQLCNFPLNTDFSTDTAIVFTKLVREGSDWDYKAIGEGKQADINGLCSYFM